MIERIVAGRGGIVADGGLDGEVCAVEGGAKFGMNKRAGGLHIDGCCAVEPDVTIDSGSLVEPSFLQGGVGTNADEIRVAVVDIFRDVVGLGDIATLLASDVETVDPDTAIAKDAVELKLKVLAVIALVYLEVAPIPSHTRLRVFPSHGLVAMAVAGSGRKRQSYHPVVRQVNRGPLCRIFLELHRIGSFVVNTVGLGQVVEVFCAATEVASRV